VAPGERLAMRSGAVGTATLRPLSSVTARVAGEARAAGSGAA
jgi:hypothetical protein